MTTIWYYVLKCQTSRCQYSHLMSSNKSVSLYNIAGHATVYNMSPKHPLTAAMQTSFRTITRYDWFRRILSHQQKRSPALLSTVLPILLPPCCLASICLIALPNITAIIILLPSPLKCDPNKYIRLESISIHEPPRGQNKCSQWLEEDEQNGQRYSSLAQEINKRTDSAFDGHAKDLSSYLFTYSSL